MEKRLIIAVVLSILVIMVFQVLLPKPAPTQFRSGSEMHSAPGAELVPASPAEYKTAQPEYPREETAEHKPTTAETQKYILTFSNAGGSLEDIKLKEYADPQTGSPLHLVGNAKLERAVFAMKSNALTTGLDKRNFSLVINEPDKIAYAYSTPGKFKIIKEYLFHNSNDYIELRLKIQNIGSEIIYKDYDILGASCLKSADMSMGRSFFEIDYIIDGKIVRSAKVKGGESVTSGIVAWTGLKERYFCIILKPQQDSEGVILRQFEKSDLATGVRSKKMPIYPGTAIEDAYILYMGPAEASRLAKPGFGFEGIINYGVFGGITKVLLASLRIFHRVVKNWGIAIIMLTVLMNIILFPLTRKSFVSMRKIQEVQPHIEKLRTVHKDNPQKLNKELAELYRQYNINPFGGCLPLLLQMPIFFALYQGLIKSVELKGAKFLWIKDLSNPDYVKLPFTLPVLGNRIHLLPLLMVVAMFIQQKTSAQNTATASKEQIQQQKVMLVFFPIFFGFLFYNFPSGLALYWFMNTILMIIESYIIKKSL